MEVNGFRKYIVRYLSDEDFGYVHISELYDLAGLTNNHIIEMNVLLDYTEEDNDLRIAFRNYFIKQFLEYHKIRGCDDLLDECYKDTHLNYLNCPDFDDDYSIDDLPWDKLDEYLNEDDYNKFINREFVETFDEVADETIKKMNNNVICEIKKLSKDRFCDGAHFTIGSYIRSTYFTARKYLILIENLRKEYGHFSDDWLSSLFLEEIWERINE